MLQTKTVNSTLLRILKGLLAIDGFESLYLVGGTSLALQLGHRVSIDIDLFGKIDFKLEEFVSDFRALGEFQILSQSKNVNILAIDGIKVDLVNYAYPLIDDLIIQDDIRLVSAKDIAAMKLNAIAGRGSKKDFIDIYYLLKQFELDELYQYYTDKYDDGNLFLVQKSLVYFKDADREKTPKLFENISWEFIKSEIVKAVI